ncbi:orotidine-5'-phosphate decarboxylase [bacterium 210917-DFI.7.65]|uniref:orotidine-5'-phosphate decarboxylase n=1 Tax=Ruthenibacterium lactatiformans TaxID=1550024 RepID=UPI001DFCA65B|nr:orotidine-5'-phosphate decarboxylase [Clostridiales bacterium]MCB6898542.1 orotidine-5'-phosphate decarboxylase [bacterium 210917-DFI.7.65]
MSFERLQDKIREMKNPTVAGLDPKLEYVPSFIVEEKMKQYGQTLRCAAEAIYEYNVGLIDALCDVVPAVKPQSAFYERFGFEGVEVLKRTVDYAKSKGLYVIMDAKRGDIGSTAEGYSEAYLGSVTIGETEVEPFGCDCLTINAYLGSDGINPFIKDCVARDRAVFALVKTSNPSSGELQNIVAGDRKVYNVVGDLLERLSKDTVDKYGYTCVGAVTGATYPMDIRDLRRRLEKTFFLVPGYGAQGGKAEDVQYAFDEYGHGAIVNSSRGIICAWQKTGKEGKDFGEAARDAAIAMREDLKKYITVV